MTQVQYQYRKTMWWKLQKLFCGYILKGIQEDIFQISCVNIITDVGNYFYVFP